MTTIAGTGSFRTTLGSLILACAVSGCATSYDQQAVWMLSKRLEAIEKSKPPVAKTSQASADGNYIILHVPISNGGYMPVKIVQMAANKFQGPKGEVYYSVPTLDQLRALYVEPLDPLAEY